MELREEFEGGAISYRLPNIPECLELMARVGITGSTSDLDNEDLKNGLLITSRLIAHMGKFITKVEVDFGDGKIADFDALACDRRAMAPLVKIANRISESLYGGSEAKKKQ